MKLSCEIVQDLLPLYEDGVCSPGSRAAVEEHLRTCRNCRRTMAINNMYVSQETAAPPDEEKIVKGIKKAKRRLFFTNFTAILALLLVCILILNQLNGVGLCFSSWDEMCIAREFAEHLEAGNYEEAAQMCDFTNRYDLYREYLSRPEEYYMLTFIPIDIDGRIWYVKDPPAQNFNLGVDTDDFWKFWLDNPYGSLIPLDVWNLYSDKSNFEMPDFIPLETPWGTYMTNAYSVEQLEKNDYSALEYCLTLDIMPEEMYHEVNYCLEEYALEQYQLVQRDYGLAGTMDESSFCDKMRDDYAKKLKTLDEQGITISVSSAYPLSRSFYRGQDGWDTCVFATVTKEDSSCRGSLLVYVQNGKIIFCSTDFPTSPDWVQDFFYIVSPVHTAEGRA